MYFLKGNMAWDTLTFSQEWLTMDKPPSAALARCKVCQNMMVLLLQLNGELPERFPHHERRLYVFACRNEKCRRKVGSVRTLRGLRTSQESVAQNILKEVQNAKGKEGSEPKQDETKGKESIPDRSLGETLFGTKGLGSGSRSTNPFASGAANPFSSSTSKPSSTPFNTTPSTNQLSPPSSTQKPPSPSQDSAASLTRSFAQTLALNNSQEITSPPPEPWPVDSSLPKPYPVSYLSDAEYETLDLTPLKVPANARMEINEPGDNEQGGSSSGGLDKELFESSMDAAFQRFADRIGKNPEQCIRYEFGGTPLLYSKDDKVGRLVAGGTRQIPRCGNCGAGRTFEVQLMPHAITELEAEELGLQGMDWGTIIVAVCERDCQEKSAGAGEEGYIEEWVGVQWEELLNET
jgi:pre-rRNA-processing protein TSR4